MKPKKRDTKLRGTCQAHARCRLRSLKIELTYRCPLKCSHCSSDAWHGHPATMQRADCMRIIDAAAAMEVDEVAFSGGEPLVCDYLVEAVEAASGKGMAVSLYTAGNTDGVEQTLKRLAERGLKRVVFSIYGDTKSAHDSVTRVPGSLSATLDAMTAAGKCGLTTEVHFVPLVSTVSEVEGVCRLARRLGAQTVSVLRFMPQGRGKHMRDEIPTKRHNVMLRDEILRLRRCGFHIRTGSPYNFLMLEEQPHCGAAVDRLTVLPDLRIAPCDAFKQFKAEDVVGDASYSSLALGTLAECWTMSPYLNAVRAVVLSSPEGTCGSCSAREKCRGGCLGQKLATFGCLSRRPDPACLLRTPRSRRVVRRDACSELSMTGRGITGVESGPKGGE